MARLRERKVIPVLVSIALAVLLSGCTVTMRPGSRPVARQNVIVWAHLGLQFTFPGVVVIQHRAGPHHYETVFHSDTSLYGVFRDVDEHMAARGWIRTDLTPRWDRISAHYQRGRQRAHVVVMDDGHSGRYRMTIDD
jgi:hypothetical protein